MKSCGAIASPFGKFLNLAHSLESRERKTDFLAIYLMPRGPQRRLDFSHGEWSSHCIARLTNQRSDVYRMRVIYRLSLNRWLLRLAHVSLRLCCADGQAPAVHVLLNKLVCFPKLLTLGDFPVNFSKVGSHRI